jgi:C4-dicarboxylate-specific signal transduction histidine kinase
VLTCTVDRQLDVQKYQLSLAQSRMELAHLNRLATAGELAASIAHEINQPLAAIAMNASTALNWLDIDPPNLPEARQAISRILKQANRANDIITGIRSMVAKSPPRTENVNMNDIIQDVLSLIGSELAKGRVTVRTELATDSPVVEGDRVQLQQVILNLLINAIEAMSHTSGRPRELVIRATKQDSRILVQVEDSGPGIDPAQADRMFQAFSTTKPQGLGMGLSISRSIIEAHGGHLSARSIDSRGAIFEVDLPIAGGRT